MTRSIVELRSTNASRKDRSINPIDYRSAVGKVGPLGISIGQTILTFAKVVFGSDRRLCFRRDYAKSSPIDGKTGARFPMRSIG